MVVVGASVVVVVGATVVVVVGGTVVVVVVGAQVVVVVVDGEQLECNFTVVVSVAFTPSSHDAFTVNVTSPVIPAGMVVVAEVLPLSGTSAL